MALLSYRRAGVVWTNGNVLRVNGAHYHQPAPIVNLLTSERCIVIETRWDLILLRYDGVRVHRYHKSDVECEYTLMPGGYLLIRDDDCEYRMWPGGRFRCRRLDPGAARPALRAHPVLPRVSPGRDRRAEIDAQGTLVLVDLFPPRRLRSGRVLV